MAQRPRSEALLIASAFFAVALIGALRHEIWRDEAQAWLLARDSASPLALLRNMRYEGHPALWHLLLWLLTRATHAVAAMQVLHATIAAASVYLIARHWPFGRTRAILLAAGYFPLYEYGVIARSYALGVALLLACCALYPRRGERPVLLALLLALLANTSIYGLLMAAALALVWWRDRPGAGRWAALLIAAGFAAAILQMAPPPDAAHAEWAANVDAGAMRSVLRGVWKSYVPLPSLKAPSFWGTNIVSDFASGDVMLGLSLLVLLLAALSLAPRLPALAFWALGTGALWLFALLKFRGSLRHQGHLWLVLLAAFWLSARAAEPAAWVRRLGRLRGWSAAVRGPLLWALLGLQAVAGLYAYAVDLRRPFSQTAAAARAVAASSLASAPLAVEPGWMGIPIAARLDRQLFLLGEERWGSYAVWRPSALARLDEPTLQARLARLVARAPGGEALLLVNRPLATGPSTVRLELLGRYEGGIVPDEDCLLYRARLDEAPRDPGPR